MINPELLATIRHQVAAGQALAAEHSTETLIAAVINAIHADPRITDDVAGQMEAHLLAWLCAITGIPMTTADGKPD